MGNGKLSLSTGSLLAFIAQSLSGGFYLWYAKFSESILCSDGDYGFMPLFPPCPEPRPYENLVLLVCASIGVGLGIVVPGLFARQAERSAMWCIAAVAIPMASFIAAIFAWQPVIAIVFAIAVLPLLGAKISQDLGIDVLADSRSADDPNHGDEDLFGPRQRDEFRHQSSQE